MQSKANSEYVIALADEIIQRVKDITGTIQKSSVFSEQSKAFKFDQAPAIATPSDLISMSKKIYSMRRKRDKIFGAEGLFADPAWDMLLDLYSVHLSNKQISITSACLAANVPATTGLRWIHVLEDAGLVERVQDTADARRTFVRLTPDAIAKLSKVILDD